MTLTPDDRRAIHALRQHQLVYLALALNFIIPAISYIVAPELAVKTMNDVNQLLGGGAWPAEQSQVWHMLAVGNVMTLGVMCLMLMLDVVRFYPALPALAFLKGFSALYSLVLGFTEGLPAFFGVFLLDGGSTVAMVFFAVRAHRALMRLDDDVRPPPLWAELLLLRPGVVRERLAEAQRAGLDELGCNLEQVADGVLRMMHRVMFRSDTIGTSSDPVRNTWRARLLAWRPLRFPFLVRERAIAPFDLSGLLSSRERILRHLLGAHHDDVQMIYDLELLACHPGALDELRARTQAVVDGSDPRSEWLRDLVVFEGYHERLLALTDDALAGTLASPDDPDISLRAFFRWCAGERGEAVKA